MTKDSPAESYEDTMKEFKRVISVDRSMLCAQWFEKHPGATQEDFDMMMAKGRRELHKLMGV